MALVVVAVFLLLVAGLTAVLGVGWLALAPLLVALLVLGWFAFAFVAGTTPRSAVRRTKRPELLGPGGPDDPNRAT
jgi:hypothetical protein